MTRDILWNALYTTGMEHARVSFGEDSLTVSGLVTGVEAESAFRVSYRLMVDASNAVREVDVNDLLGKLPPLKLRSAGAGRWTDAKGVVQPEFDGCIDVDITVTPLTNMLPIRRLGLLPGECRDIKLVYIYAPQMRVTTDEQRYTCLSIESDEARYHFQSGDFHADLRVDFDGLVIEYPGLFQRVWSNRTDA